MTFTVCLTLLLMLGNHIHPSFQQTSSDAIGEDDVTADAGNPLEVNWHIRDRRGEEGWWDLYPFGERYFDSDVLPRWHDNQFDLDFLFPYLGFRFNYTFIYPDGFAAFSYPNSVQPPYSLPVADWPARPDPSLIAAFMGPSSSAFLGETAISHLWVRVVSRPLSLIGKQCIKLKQPPEFVPPSKIYNNWWAVVQTDKTGNPKFRNYKGRKLKIQSGRVEDPEMLDIITQDIRNGIVGAQGFSADFALIATWERFEEDGASKIVPLNQYEESKKRLNTFQMVLASDEVRSYVIFNYAHLKGTSSPEGGEGKTAVVGFNGGNGTGFHRLPLRQKHDAPVELLQQGNGEVSGRWIARVDEEIQFGGCGEPGVFTMDRRYGSLLGGFAISVSGPCFKESDSIKLRLGESVVDCGRASKIVARCQVPFGLLYTPGLVNVSLSADGGQQFKYHSNFYFVPVTPQDNLFHTVKLVDKQDGNNWNALSPTNLSLLWQGQNLTSDPDSGVTITLWGYHEDLGQKELSVIGTIATDIPNIDTYSFNPQGIRKNFQMDANKELQIWEKFNFGIVQVSVSDLDWTNENGDGVQWSGLVPLSWYFKDIWEDKLGQQWAEDKCEHLLQSENNAKRTRPEAPCPCNVEQAKLDIGGFVPAYQCGWLSSGYCPYFGGAAHCFIPVYSTSEKFSQTCCYDFGGVLMKPLGASDSGLSPKFYRQLSPGVVLPSHPVSFTANHVSQEDQLVPGLSSFHNDIMPYEACCRWADECESYWQQRIRVACEGYSAPVHGYARGEAAFVTYDGDEYRFNETGYYLLTDAKSAGGRLTVQIRIEQPLQQIRKKRKPKPENSTITGVAAQEGDSDIVQVFARKDHRRWRYKTDIYVNDNRIFTDRPEQKLQQFAGVTLISPEINHNQSEIDVVFSSGVGMRVTEIAGRLEVMMTIPTTPLHETGSDQSSDPASRPRANRITGLLGSYDGKKPRFTVPENKSDAISRWKIENSSPDLLFQSKHEKLYSS